MVPLPFWDVFKPLASFIYLLVLGEGKSLTSGGLLAGSSKTSSCHEDAKLLFFSFGLKD